MSTIDDLQRLHEAAPQGEWRASLCGDYVIAPGEGEDDPAYVAAVVALHNAWPAIHRVLVAAREVAANTADDIDERLRYVEVRPGRDEWQELVEALRALDDKEQGR